MKQFIRYLSLITCVLLIGLWVLSYYRTFGVDWNRSASYHATGINDGGILYASAGWKHPNKPIGWNLINERTVDLESPSVYGFILRHDVGLRYRLIAIPIWFIFIPLFLINLRLWYAPFKAWRRGANQQGFEVELKSDTKVM